MSFVVSIVLAIFIYPSFSYSQELTEPLSPKDYQTIGVKDSLPVFYTKLADSVVPFVGTHYPLDDEQDIFNAITDSLRSIIQRKTLLFLFSNDATAKSLKI